jgi:hypothetical protein
VDRLILLENINTGLQQVEEEKRKIEQGQLDLEKGHVAPYEAI